MYNLTNLHITQKVKAWDLIGKTHYIRELEKFQGS